MRPPAPRMRSVFRPSSVRSRADLGDFVPREARLAHERPGRDALIRDLDALGSAGRGPQRTGGVTHDGAPTAMARAMSRTGTAEGETSVMPADWRASASARAPDGERGSYGHGRAIPRWSHRRIPRAGPGCDQGRVYAIATRQPDFRRSRDATARARARPDPAAGGAGAGRTARHRGVRDRRRLRLLRQAPAAERDGRRRARRRPGPAERRDRDRDGDLVRGREQPANSPSFTFTYQTKCTATADRRDRLQRGRQPERSSSCSGTATTNTWFAGIFGIDHFNVSAHANACSPCSSTPVDIVIAIDRTGSMCTPRTAAATASTSTTPRTACARCWACSTRPRRRSAWSRSHRCRRRRQAPARRPTTRSAATATTATTAATRGYVTDTHQRQLQDRSRAQPRHPGSTCTRWTAPLVVHPVRRQHVLQRGSAPGPGRARRERASERARLHRLPDRRRGQHRQRLRPDTAYPQGNADDQQPARRPSTLANSYKAAGTTIYSIGYALGKQRQLHGRRLPQEEQPAATGSPCTATATADCYHYASSTDESPAITSYNTLSQIASPGNFYNQPSAGQLDTIFAAIATDIGQGSSRLVDDSF